MRYALSRPSPTARSGLLGVVIALHAGTFLLILAARTVVPQISEMPLVVDLLEPAPIESPPAVKPLPADKPQAIKQARTPSQKAPAPALDATQSNAPSPAAPIAVAADPQPAPAPEPVSQARFDADYLRNPAPPYPPLSRRMQEEGKVMLRVSVNAQGTADSVDLKISSGSPRLDEAAQKTVRTWKFIPAKRGATPIQSWVLVPIIFKLEQ